MRNWPKKAISGSRRRKRRFQASLVGSSLLLLILAPFLSLKQIALGKESPSRPSQMVHISGRVLDPHLEPVKEAKISVSLDGQRQELVSAGKKSLEISTDCKGWYLAEFFPSSQIQGSSKLELEISKPGFMAIRVPIEGGELAQRGEHLHFTKHVSMPRKLGSGALISACIFLAVYIAIALELVHRTVAAMGGIVLVLLVSSTVGSFLPDYRIISFSSAAQAVDLNVMALLLGAMLTAGALKTTGIFDWIVSKCFLIGRSRVRTVSVLLVLSTAVLSSLVDNVAAIVLLAPMSIKLAQAIRVNPVNFLIPQVLASNLGGTATLVGNITNVMIGSASGMSFVDFLENLGPLCGLGFIVLVAMTVLGTRKKEQMGSAQEPLGEVESPEVKDRPFLTLGIIVTCAVVGLLFFHGSWKMEPSIPVLAGGTVLFTYGVVTRRLRLIEFLEREVEWPLLLFLFCLFGMVGAMEQSGALFSLSEALASLSQWDPAVSISLILWGSALVAAFVDNLPLTAAMLPVVSHLSHALPDGNLQGFWWALALGVSLGANGTVVGGSANMVAMGMVSSAGYPVSFFHFLKFGFPYMIISVALSNAWLIAFYT